MDSWNKQLKRLIGDDEVIWCSIDKDELDRKFDSTFGGVEGTPFIAYTKEYVIFCIQYDGAEWLEKVPRNPDRDFYTEHYGG